MVTFGFERLLRHTMNTKWFCYEMWQKSGYSGTDPFYYSVIC